MARVEKRENETKRKAPRDTLYEDFAPAPLPVNPETGDIIAAGPVAPPEAAPPVTPEHSVCQRDCRHYWNLQTLPPDGRWKNNPLRQNHHVCLVNEGMETEFGDDNVFSCSKWDPYTKRELVQIRKRREHYFKRNPHLRETP